jgi:hypothetical protein
MTEPPHERSDKPDEWPDESRVERRAELLPEEETAGSEDRAQQARAILEESDERTDHPQETRHASYQTPG